MQTISSAGYNIYTGPESLTQLPALITGFDATQVTILTDDNTQKHCLPHLPLNRDWNVIALPAGEHNKTLSTASFVWERLLEMNIHRNGLLINLGGGVVGDMGGFCASVWNRGISFLQIPTTLLAMVDASCGGKTGIDFGGVKNKIGTFRMPLAVIVVPAFLNTLPERELMSGLAEMIKHAIISGNKEHFRQLGSLQTITPDSIAPYIHDSIAIKNHIVLQDPEEKGVRKILNFGHTIGHALEALSLNSKTPLLHGEAVALGMEYEIKLALLKRFISEETACDYIGLIKRFFSHLSCEGYSFDLLTGLLQKDKKNTAGHIMFALPREKSSFEWNVPASLQEIQEAFSMRG